MKELRENERKVLYGLLLDPSANLRELSEQIGIKLSTVAKIRSRLFTKYDVKQVWLPCFGVLGTEIMAVLYGTANVTPTTHPQDVLTHIEPVTTLLIDKSTGLAIAFYRDFTEMRENITGIERTLGHTPWVSITSLQVHPFSLNLARIYNFFNFIPIYNSIYGDEGGSEVTIESILCEMPKLRPLTRVERSVIDGLVNNPMASDMQVAEACGVSRQVVSKTKNRLLEDELIKRRTIPCLGSFGLDILCQMNYRFRTDSSNEDQDAVITASVLRGRNILSVCEGFTVTQLFLFRNIDEIRAERDALVQSMREREVIVEEPTTNLLSVPSMRIMRFHDYGPMVSRRLSRSNGNRSD